MWHLIPRVDTVSAVPGYRGRKAKKTLRDEVRKEAPGSSPRKKRLVGAKACRPLAGDPGWAQAPQETEWVWSCVPEVLWQASPADSPGELQLSA